MSTRELAERASARWGTDPEFRRRVTELRDRADVLRFQDEEVGLSDDADDELRDIEEALEFLGVPDSWKPETGDDD